MITQKIFFIIFVLLLPVYHSEKVENLNPLEDKTSTAYNTINIDSVISEVNINGWNNALLFNYQNYIYNSSIDFEQELKRINTLKGDYQPSYLEALLYKKEGKFKEMFDKLLPLLSRQIRYLNYYNELVYSARAVNLLSTIKNKIEKKNPPVYSSYIMSLVQSAKGENNSSLEYLSKTLKRDSTSFEILFQQFSLNRSLGNYENGFYILSRMEVIYGSYPWYSSRILNQKAALLYLSGDHSNAGKLYKNALAVSESIGNNHEKVRALAGLAILDDEKGRTEEGLEKYKTALDISENIKEIELKAFVLAEMGVSYSFTNNLIDAKSCYKKSYDLYKKVNNKVRLSLLSNNLGKLFMQLFEFRTALRFYEDGLNYAGENKRALVLNLTGIADIYTNMSNYSKAIKYYKDAEKISSEIKDVRLKSDVELGLGILNFNLDRYSSALKYFYSAESALKDDIYSLGDLYHKIGLSYLNLDSLNKAEYYLKDALLKARNSGDNYFEAIYLVDYASLLNKKQLYEEAKKQLNLAKTISLNNNFHYQQCSAELLYGEIALQQGDILKAKYYYENALKLAVDLDEPGLLIETKYSLARLYERSNLLELSESFYNQTVQLIETKYSSLSAQDDIQIAYFSGKQEVYNSFAEFYLNKKEYMKAFYLIEKSRAKNLIQNLGNLKLISIIENDSLIERLYDLDWMVNSGLYTGREYDSITIAYEDLKNDVVAKYPGSEKYLSRQKDPELEDIRNTLKNNENIISYYTTDSNTYLFLIKKNLFKTFELGIGKKEIEKLIKDISPYYGAGNTGAYYNQDLFSYNARGASVFFEKLIKPALGLVSKNDKIIFSLPVFLSVVPFEFLTMRYDSEESPFEYSGKDFLINHYSISYTPSVRTYLEQSKNGYKNDNKIVLLGNPSINNNKEGYSERRGLLDEGPGIPRNVSLLPLKYSEEEVNEIEDIISADEILLNNSATESNFKNTSQLSKIIHLSTHSFLVNKQPVIFFSNMDDPDNDGFLEAGEIVQLKLNSDLVVLSSCNSGLGKFDDAEGIIGMTKAFFETGSKSVVVSLWDVNDKYTSKLMSLFYKNLDNGLSKTDALRAAKIEFIKKYSANPYYWGAFVLNGDISQIDFDKGFNLALLIYIFMFVAAVSGIVVFILKRKSLKTDLITTH